MPKVDAVKIITVVTFIEFYILFFLLLLQEGDVVDQGKVFLNSLLLPTNKNWQVDFFSDDEETKLSLTKLLVWGEFWPCWFDNRSKNNERVDHCHIVSTWLLLFYDEIPSSASSSSSWGMGQHRKSKIVTWVQEVEKPRLLVEQQKK